MADFFDPQQQDPDAIRKAMLLRIFGIAPGMAPGAAPGAPGPSGIAPTAMTPAAAPAAPVAKPLATANRNGGPVEPGAQPPAPVLSEADWQKQNPLPEHTPYTPPDLKHRVLMGLVTAIAAGGRGLRAEQADITAKTKAEQQWPLTAEATQNQRYQGYLQGQKGPLDIQDLQAQINERQAQAKERAAKALAEQNPPKKLQHFVIDDPEHPGQPKAVNFDQATGAYLDPDSGNAIPGAKPWEKAAPEKKLNDFEGFYTRWLKDNNQQDTAANLLKAHKEWEIKPEQPGAATGRGDKSYQFHSTQIEKVRAPIETRMEKIGIALDNLAQRNPQADALMAPEILTAMVGGQGSGLRMNDAEITRIIGGATKWTELKTKLNQWSFDPQHVIFTDEQRGQMQKILEAGRTKLSAKQKVIEEADDALLNADEPKEHRRIVNEMHKKLDALDAGASPPSGAATDAKNPLGL